MNDNTILGYPCINWQLAEQGIRTNRSMKKATWLSKGIERASDLALQNVKGLYEIVKWNTANDIKFFRISSELFPWMSEYSFEELPQFDEIRQTLLLIGLHATDNHQRLGFHPGQHNCLASPSPAVVSNSFNDLNQHSRILNLMGFEPTTYNKLNIHVGGSYGNKTATIERWLKNFDKLEDHTKARLTIENDDKAGGYNAIELLDLSNRSNVPIVFDYHHHECYNDGIPEKEAFDAAYSTWHNVVPAMHKSSKRDFLPGQNPRAHHDMITEAFTDYGKPIYVMLEAKKKEEALIEYRNNNFIFS